MNAHADWLTHFRSTAAALPGSGVHWVSAARNAAMARFSAASLPGPGMESWKYTAAMAPSAQAASHATEASLANCPLAEGSRFVFVDGVFDATLSSPPDALPGLRITPLGVLLRETPEAARPFFGDTPSAPGRAAADDAHDWLNTALTRDGLLIELAADATVETPLVIAHIASQPGNHFTRHVVRLGTNSQATLVEWTNALDGHHLNQRLDVQLEGRARLDHVSWLDGASGNTLHRLTATLGQNARLNSHHLAFGGGRQRQERRIRLQGEAANCVLSGLALADDARHIDWDVRIDHAAARSHSLTRHRAVAEGQGRSVFTGRVVVHPEAPGCEARQDSRSLLLSREAEADARPQLEIHNDDVVCSHGATVGQLDDQALFYLQSRGIDAEEARALLVHGFAADLLDALPSATLRSTAHSRLLAGLPQAGALTHPEDLMPGAPS